MRLSDCRQQRRPRHRRNAADGDDELREGREEEDTAEEVGANVIDDAAEEDTERALPDDVRPGLAFWVVVNVGTGTCQDFVELIRSKFVKSGFIFSSLKVMSV